ncbi:Kelch repeat-containing protein [Nocardioides sp. MAHUQ-72]|uniref:Kelch repeat-containing protein n=1 Tax=unclassified Nocardioides TaxID=2615069 RepID=UPI00361E37C2
MSGVLLAGTGALHPGSSSAAASVTVPRTTAVGNLKVTAERVVAGSTRDLTFTYTAPRSRAVTGSMRVTFPHPWTVPQTRKPRQPGYVEVVRRGCRSAAITARTRQVSSWRLQLDVTCPAGKSFTIVYSDATAPTTAGTAAFDARAKLEQWSQYRPLAKRTTLTVHPAAASRLDFTGQPGNSLAGTTLAPAPTVTLRDKYGNTADSSATVTLTATGVPAGTAGGTTSVEARKGVATFDDVHLDHASSGYRLRASSGSIPAVESRRFTVDATWTMSGQTIQARQQRPGLVKLPDGRVLLAGGYDGTSPWEQVATTAEIYDPATRTWTSTTPMNAAHHMSSAYVLPDGRVLLTGGDQGDPELYDPESGVWTPTSAPSRFGSLSTQLTDGRILSIPSAAYDADRIAEVYDPATGVWSPAGGLHANHVDGGIVTLGDGRVLVVGGGNGNGAYTAVAEVWDPATDEWTVIGPMHGARSQLAIALLGDGRVFVADGDITSTDRKPEIWDPATGAWSEVSGYSHMRTGSVATTLADGRVLVAAGQHGPVKYPLADEKAPMTAVYDPATDTWSSTEGHTDYPVGVGFQAVTLDDGHVLHVGGSYGSRLTLLYGDAD